jgi:hypothetical protein
VGLVWHYVGRLSQLISWNACIIRKHCCCNFKFIFRSFFFVFWPYAIIENFLFLNKCGESITVSWLPWIMEGINKITMVLQHIKNIIFLFPFLAVYKAISNPSFTSNPSIWNQPDPLIFFCFIEILYLDVI